VEVSKIKYNLEHGVLEIPGFLNQGFFIHFPALFDSIVWIDRWLLYLKKSISTYS
jgi:hypothetical protein